MAIPEIGKREGLSNDGGCVDSFVSAWEAVRTVDSADFKAKLSSWEDIGDEYGGEIFSRGAKRKI